MRSWLRDGVVLTVEDAEQVVDFYRANYSSSRFIWLMLLAANHGHEKEIADVFRSVLQ